MEGFLRMVHLLRVNLPTLHHQSQLTSRLPLLDVPEPVIAAAGVVLAGLVTVEVRREKGQAKVLRDRDQEANHLVPETPPPLGVKLLRQSSIMPLLL